MVRRPLQFRRRVLRWRDRIPNCELGGADLGHPERINTETTQGIRWRVTSNETRHLLACNFTAQLTENAEELRGAHKINAFVPQKPWFAVNVHCVLRKKPTAESEVCVTVLDCESRHWAETCRRQPRVRVSAHRRPSEIHETQATSRNQRMKTNMTSGR